MPYVVEELHAGKLVYAGGDDVLALLPLKDMLPVARKLRLSFQAKLKGNLMATFSLNLEASNGLAGWTGTDENF